MPTEIISWKSNGLDRLMIEGTFYHQSWDAFMPRGIDRVEESDTLGLFRERPIGRLRSHGDER
jgi:hypothetical protein